MSFLRTDTVTVTSRVDGAKTEALVFVCSRCGRESADPLFIVFAVNEHPHLQCAYCDETYCTRGGECK